MQVVAGEGGAGGSGLHGRGSIAQGGVGTWVGGAGAGVPRHASCFVGIGQAATYTFLAAIRVPLVLQAGYVCTKLLAWLTWGVLGVLGVWGAWVRVGVEALAVARAA